MAKKCEIKPYINEQPLSDKDKVFINNKHNEIVERLEETGIFKNIKGKLVTLESNILKAKQSIKLVNKFYKKRVVALTDKNSVRVNALSLRHKPVEEQNLSEDIDIELEDNFNSVAIKNIAYKVKEIKDLDEILEHINKYSEILIPDLQYFINNVSIEMVDHLKSLPAMNIPYNNAYTELSNKIIEATGIITYTREWKDSLIPFNVLNKEGKTYDNKTEEVPFDILVAYNNVPEIWEISESAEQFYNFIKDKTFIDENDLIKKYKKYIETYELNGTEAVNLPCL